MRDAKKLDWEAFRCVPDSAMKGALEGHGLHRVEKNWDVPRFLENGDLQAMFRKCLGKAFAKVTACRHFGCQALPRRALQQ